VVEVLAEVLKDRVFYERSGGGLTLSGGEPMLQFDFAKALLSAAKRERLHTVIETCGAAPFEQFEAVRPDVDLFYYDIKETDDARHREYTGVSNEQILENVRKLDATGAPIVLRCPIIPGLNDRDEHFAAIAGLAGELKQVTEVHVLPYHLLGSSKSQRLGKTYALSEVKMPEEVVVARWVADLQARTRVPVRRD